MKKIYIPIILGTGRKGRQSEQVAKLIFRHAKKLNIKTEIIDVKNYASKFTIPSWIEDKRTAPWKKIAQSANAFFWIVPEYNHGYPGELKNVIDQAFSEYRDKPCSIAGVSNGGFGGTRAIESFLHVLGAIGMILIPKQINFSFVEKDFSEMSEKELDEKYSKKIKETFAVLIEYSNKLK